MKNYVQPGLNVTIPAPSSVSAGEGVLAGSLFGVAVHDADSGDDVTITCEGVFDLPKTDEQAWTVGALIYWNASSDICTTVASTHKKIGVAVEAVADTAGLTTGRVRLTGASSN
jgi:predicted RecA/RadA family phage recombinase